jgi:hypothetical protein
MAGKALSEFLDSTPEGRGWASIRDVHFSRFLGFNDYPQAAAIRLANKFEGLRKLTLTFDAESLRLVEDTRVPLSMGDFAAEDKLEELFACHTLEKVTLEFFDSVSSWDRSGRKVSAPCALWGRQVMLVAMEWLRSELPLRKLNVEFEGMWIWRDCRSQKRGRYVEMSFEGVKTLRRKRAEREGLTGA